MESYIPVLRPSFGEEEVEAVAEVLRSGWAGLGPRTKAFEDEFAAYVGAAHAVGLNSGTAALHLALLAAGVGPGDEVIVTPITFVSTVHAVEYVGATPVFADVDPRTLNIDPADVAAKVTPRTRAVICVHYGGNPCDLDRLGALCRRHDLTLVEDAAHACGATYDGQRIGSISRLTCFSFHAVKNLAMGEGGAITCHDPALDTHLRKLRWLGISKDTFQRTVEHQVYAWQYWVEHLGFKYHLSDVAAAIGRVQLRKLPANNERRARLAARYTAAFADLEPIETPTVTESAESAWHLYPIKLPDLAARDALIAWLKERGVAPGVHYYPIHLHPYYAPRHAGAAPVAARVWERVLSLPLFPDLTEAEQEQVVGAVRGFVLRGTG